MKKLLPAVVLFFLSPAIAELLSGSAPPIEFFNPFGFVLLTTLYGSGAILARELKMRWQKGWISLLVLGAAYGIVEEGLVVKSFFDPNWVDIGILGSYGRWVGVNWVWSVELMFYHAIISIAIPILLVELIFPQRRDETWIGRKTFVILSVLITADVVFGYFALTTYRPGAVQYWLAVAIVVALIIIAWRIPRQPFAPKDIVVRHPVWFWLTGFLGTIAFFIVFGVLPNTVLHPVTTIIIGIAFMTLGSLAIMRMSGNGAAWAEKHRLALAAGPLTLFILFAPVQEFDTSRVDNTAGMTVVGIVALFFLLWLWRWVRKYSIESGKTSV